MVKARLSKILAVSALSLAAGLNSAQAKEIETNTARLQAMEGSGWENMQAEDYARFCEKYGQYTRLLEVYHDEQQAQGQRRGA